MARQRSSVNAKIVSGAITVMFLGFYVFDGWFLIVVLPGAWYEKSQLVFVLLGLYTLTFGFLRETEFLKLGDLRNNLTSHHPFEFISGIMMVLGFMYLSVSIMARSRPGARWTAASLERVRNPELFNIPLLSPVVRLLLALGIGLTALSLSFLSLAMVVAIAGLAIVFTVTFLVVAAPVVYLAYAVVSIPALLITRAPKGYDYKVRYGDQTVSIRETWKLNDMIFKTLFITAVSFGLSGAFQFVYGLD